MDKDTKLEFEALARVCREDVEDLYRQAFELLRDVKITAPRKPAKGT
jgi:hypothetical protein